MLASLAMATSSDHLFRSLVLGRLTRAPAIAPPTFWVGQRVKFLVCFLFIGAVHARAGSSSAAIDPT